MNHREAEKTLTLKTFVMYGNAFFKSFGDQLNNAIVEAKKGNTIKLLKYILAGYIFECQGTSPYFSGNR